MNLSNISFESNDYAVRFVMNSDGERMIQFADQSGRAELPFEMLQDVIEHLQFIYAHAGEHGGNSND